MGRVISNTVFGILNLGLLLIGMVFLGRGIDLYVRVGSLCQTSLTTPLLIVGDIIFGMSLLGFVASASNKNSIILKTYFSLMSLLILGLIGFTVFVFLVSNESVGNAGKGYFSNWLANQFVKKKWDAIVTCLTDTEVCSGPSHKFHHQCCGAPKECLHLWDILSEDIINNYCPDIIYDPYEGECYSCTKCQAGFLEDVRNQWGIMAMELLCITVFTITVFYVALFAMRMHRKINLLGW
ncbi:hypothetical protein Tsubulata_000766 [Turnera subulata]|uniref:Tetraspanin n=1 Tax=Turnera subulata TaxID=218843 RepID=A0A9Q0G9K0_9ROSI|nr:hypothetical protein Tsubulata_000766 [Turnera subulata]